MSRIYVVVEITNPNMCFGFNQTQYIKYEENKQLSIVGAYTTIEAAQFECNKGHSRRILQTILYGDTKTVSFPFPDYKPTIFPQPQPLFPTNPFSPNPFSLFNNNNNTNNNMDVDRKL